MQDALAEFCEEVSNPASPLTLRRLVKGAVESGASDAEIYELTKKFLNQRRLHRHRMASDAFGYFVELEGLKVYVYEPQIDGAISTDLLTGNPPEPFEIEEFCSYLDVGNTVIDAGANIGYFSLRYAQAVGEQGRVWAFEPDLWNFQILQQNILVNGFSQITAYQCALGNGNGEVILFRNPYNRGDIRAWKEDHEYAPSIPCLCTSLDGFLPQPYPRVHGMKIDVQGMEIAVLHGAKKLIEAQPTFVLMTEYWPKGLKALHGNRWSLQHTLESLGFTKIFRSDGFREQIIEISSLDEIPDTVDGHENGANLLCLKR